LILGCWQQLVSKGFIITFLADPRRYHHQRCMKLINLHPRSSKMAHYIASRGRGRVSMSLYSISSKHASCSGIPLGRDSALPNPLLRPYRSEARCILPCEHQQPLSLYSSSCYSQSATYITMFRTPTAISLLSILLPSYPAFGSKAQGSRCPSETGTRIMELACRAIGRTPRRELLSVRAYGKKKFSYSFQGLKNDVRMAG